MTFAGIDYSMTCPAMTILNQDLGKYSFYYLHKVSKRVVNEPGRLESDLLDKNESVIEGNRQGETLLSMRRFDKIASWFIERIVREAVDVVFIENYSFGSRGGLAFSIAENTTTLKMKLYNLNIKTRIIPPTTVKKFATGKGTATKEMMVDAFHGVMPPFEVLQEYSHDSPYTDLVDSYWVLQSGLDLTSQKA